MKKSLRRKKTGIEKYLLLLVSGATVLFLTSCEAKPSEPVITNIDSNIQIISTKEDTTYLFYDGLVGLKISNDSKYTISEPYTLQEIQGDMVAGDIVFEVVSRSDSSERYAGAVRRKDYLLGYDSVFWSPYGNICIDLADQKNSDTIIEDMVFIHKGELQDTPTILKAIESCAVVTPINEKNTNIAFFHVYPVDYPYYNIMEDEPYQFIFDNEVKFYTPANELFKKCNIDMTNKNASYTMFNIDNNNQNLAQIKKIVENVEFVVYEQRPITEQFKITNIQEGESYDEPSESVQIDFYPQELEYEINDNGDRVYQLNNDEYEFFEMILPNDLGTNILVGEYNESSVFGIYYISETDPTNYEEIVEYRIGEGMNNASGCCNSNEYFSNLIFQFSNGYRIIEAKNISFDLFDEQDRKNYEIAASFLQDKIVFIEK